MDKKIIIGIIVLLIIGVFFLYTPVSKTEGPQQETSSTDNERVDRIWI